jgi:hypothetical protein
MKDGKGNPRSSQITGSRWKEWRPEKTAPSLLGAVAALLAAGRAGPVGNYGVSSSRSSAAQWCGRLRL